MDPLSDVLSLLEPEGTHFAGLRAGGQWAIAFPPPDGLKFNALVEGTCFLSVDGAGPPVRLDAGDCFLLSQPRAFTLSSEPDIEPVDAHEVFRTSQQGVAQYGEAQETFLTGGAFSFPEEAKIVLGVLPPLVVIRSASESAPVLQWSLRRFAHELVSSLPGSALMARQLGYMMLIEVLRLCMSDRDNPGGWLFALSDPRVNAAIEAVHADPARRWTVAKLAGLAGVSRSTFALHFTRKVGHSPLEYVTRWRVHLACRELRMHDATISSIGQTLGYESDSAFSNTFKRLMACSPRDYRVRQRAMSSTSSHAPTVDHTPA